MDRIRQLLGIGRPGRRDGKASIELTEREEVINEMRLKMIDPYGQGAWYALSILLGLMFFLLVGILIYSILDVFTRVLAVIALVNFIVTRHVQVKSKDKISMGRNFIAAVDKHPGIDLDNLPAAYFLYVFGSGGHSTEMAMTIRNMFRGNAKIHRRYVMGLEDTYSWGLVQKLEAKIHAAYDMKTAGTYDTFGVTRARSIGQSFITSIFTSAMCAFNVIVALTAIPLLRPENTYGQAYRFPHVIITNGPGSGFIVGVMAHLLKMFYLAPQTHLKVVYIESVARVENLSLTGKLFNLTDIANLFLVQSDELAKKVGKPSIGLLAIRDAPAGVGPTKD